ncbi:hypothetical protein VCR14J2_610191 [Vibrio coralliirubri]|nr:hypothetical protein VCR14J2_610191 [Vibrio coralliirubri]
MYLESTLVGIAGVR